MKTLFGFMFILESAFLISQDKIKIYGHINDNKNKSIEGALIQLENTSIYTYSGENGHYEFYAPRGKYTINVSSIGHKGVKKQIELENKDFHIDLNMREDILGLDQVVVSGTRGHLNRRESVVSVGVLSSEVFYKTQSNSLFDGLKFQSGLRIDVTCQNSGSSIVSINGMPGEYSQILVNGKPIFTLASGIYGLEQIPSNTIERVEVIRGGTSIYGSNAIAGTINIITKEPEGNTFSIDNNTMLIGGSSVDNISKGNISLVSENKDYGATIVYNARLRNPYDVDKDGFSEISKLRSTFLNTAIFYKISDKSKIDFNISGVTENRRGGDMRMNLPSHQVLLSEEMNTNMYFGGISWDGFFNDNIKYSYYANAQNIDMPLYHGHGYSEEEGHEHEVHHNEGFGKISSESYILGNQYNFKINDFIKGEKNVVVGLEYKNDFLRDVKPGNEKIVTQKINSIGLFAQDNWKINDSFSLLLGLRGDYYGTEYLDRYMRDFQLNPTTSLMYNVDKKYFFRIGYSRGFRTPQLSSDAVHSELSGEEMRQIVISENIKSEKSNTYNLSFEYIPEYDTWGLGFLAEVFYTQLIDPFVIEEAVSSTEGIRNMQLVNGTGADIKGINFETKLAYKDILQFQINATYQHNIYDEEVNWSQSALPSDKFFRTPSLYGGFITSYNPIEEFQINFSGNYTGSQYIPHFKGYIEEDRLEKVRDFFELNVKLAYDFSLKEDLKFGINAGINNILNSYQSDIDKTSQKDADYIYGPTAPRTFFVGVSFSYE